MASLLKILGVTVGVIGVTCIGGCTLLVVGGAVAGCAGCASLSSFTNYSAGYSRTATSTAACAGQLTVKTSNGSITVTKDASLKEASITATLHGSTQQRADAAQLITAPTADGGLAIEIVWPEKRQPSEGCDIEVRLPDATALVLESSNGAVNVTGMRGLLTIDTSNAEINVTDHAGEVRAETSNGPVNMVNVQGSVTVDTSNASVDVTLADGNPGPFVIESSNGSITIEMDESFAGTLVADTSNGEVTVSKDGTIVSSGKDAVWTATDAGPKSTLDTSNSDIEVRIRKTSPGDKTKKPFIVRESI